MTNIKFTLGSLMDAIFYNDSGDRFFGGKQFIVSKTGTGGIPTVPPIVPIGINGLTNVPFKFLQLSETQMVISWSSFSFRSSGAFVVFADIPQQFVGTTTAAAKSYSLPIILHSFAGGFNVVGTIKIDVVNRTFTFGMSKTQIVGADTLLADYNFTNGIDYAVISASVTIERIFE